MRVSEHLSPKACKHAKGPKGENNANQERHLFILLEQTLFLYIPLMFRSWNKRLILVAALSLVAILCTVCSDDNFGKVQRTINLHRDSLNAETWLEVEKNDSLNICIDAKVRTWETSLDTEVLNDSCLKIQVPTLIGVYPINVKFSDSDSAYKINLVVGMKYLNFKNEETLPLYCQIVYWHLYPHLFHRSYISLSVNNSRPVHLKKHHQFFRPGNRRH